jgi:hypothetical protein
VVGGRKARCFSIGRSNLKLPFLNQINNKLQRFVDAVVEFCTTSTLKAGAMWLGAPRPGGAASAGGWTRRSVQPEGGATRTPGLPPALAASPCPPAAALLSEPRGAATEAQQRFHVGESLASIATTGRPKPISPMTVAGYLADAAGFGIQVDLDRVAAEARLDSIGARVVAEAVAAHGAGGLGAVKRALPPTWEYGQVKLVAALMHLGALWFAGGGEGGPGVAQQPRTADPQQGQPAKRVRMEGERGSGAAAENTPWRSVQRGGPGGP